MSLVYCGSEPLCSGVVGVQLEAQESGDDLASHLSQKGPPGSHTVGAR